VTPLSRRPRRRPPVFVYSPLMPGLHLTADCYRCRCDAAWLADADRLGDWCVKAVRAVGLEPADRAFRAAAAPGGVTGAVLLAHAHVAVHTWPGRRSAALDVYLGEAADGQPAQARTLMTALVERFAPEWTEQRSLDRGDGET